MSVNNGKITPPISIDDVKSVLGESSNDVATLCKSTKINKWARYKPVACAAIFDNKDGAGDDGAYGLSVLPVDYSKIVSEYYKYDDYYKYNKRPTGGASSPFRLGDFKGYNHKAIGTVSCPVTVERVYNEGTPNEIIIYESISDGDSIATDENPPYLAVYTLGIDCVPVESLSILKDMKLSIYYKGALGGLGSFNQVSNDKYGVKRAIYLNPNKREGDFILYPYLTSSDGKSCYLFPGCKPIKVTFAKRANIIANNIRIEHNVVNGVNRMRFVAKNIKTKTNIILAVTGTPVAIGGLIGDDREIYITLCNVNIASDTTSSWYSFTKEKGYEYKVDLYVDNRIIRTEKVPDVTYKPI